MSFYKNISIFGLTVAIINSDYKYPEVNLYEDDNNNDDNNVTYGDITVHNARGYYDCENFNGLIAHCYTLL